MLCDEGTTLFDECFERLGNEELKVCTLIDSVMDREAVLAELGEMDLVDMPVIRHA